jgi:muramidase (phage lysozyme)
LADNNRPTYNPQTNNYSVGKFNVPGQNLNPSQRASADRRYNTKEFFGGLREGFADIGKGIKQTFDPKQKIAQSRVNTGSSSSSSSSAQSTAQQIKMQSSSLMSIDAKLEDIVLSQRTMQQDVNRLVFLVEEMKGGIGRDRNYPPAESTREVVRETGGDDRSILDILLDSLGGPDGRRGRSRPRPSTPRPTATSGILNTLRGALFNPITAGMAGAGALTAGTIFGSAAIGDYAESLMGTKEKIKAREGTEEYKELQQTQQQLSERARARQGLATEGGASPGGPQRLTDEQKKQWIALPTEEKRKFQNNPTEWLKSQQASPEMRRSTSTESFTDTEVGFSTNSTSEARLAKKLKAAYNNNNTITLDQYKKGIEYIESNRDERGGFSRQKLKEDFDILGYVGAGAVSVSRQPITTSGSSTPTSGPSVTVSGQSATVSTPARPSASDTTTSQTTASERGLREAEKARQGDDIRLNVKSYDLDSKGPLIFKSPSIRFETDRLEFIFREKVEKGAGDKPPTSATPVPSPNGQGGGEQGAVSVVPPPSGMGGSSATPSPSTGASGGITPSIGGGAGTPSGAQRPSSSGTAPNSVQDTSIPAQGRGLLNEIARTEGGNLGYNAINYVAARTYGRTFSDFSKHPFQGQKGYTAAGRYQFIWTTWNSVAKDLNITDFSPKSQDAGCWYLAKKLYSRYGNLEEDLKNPQKYDTILQVLRGTWHGLKNSNSRTLAEEIRKAGLNTQKQEAGAATPVSASPATVAPSPSPESSSAGGGSGAGSPTGNTGGTGTSDASPSATPTESATPGGAEKQESEPDAKPVEGAPGQTGAGAGVGKTGGGGNVRQAQSGIRKLPISDKLNSVLQQAARAAGVDVTVTSGGQPAYPKGPRTGSTRHDLGNAADLDLYVGGRILSDRNPADIELKKKFVAAATGAGASGIGAGYMGPTKIHVGFGTPAKWGGAPWLSGITPGSGAGSTTTPSGGAAGGGTGAGGGAGGGGATPMGGRGVGGGMSPMGGGGMGMDPGAMIGGMLGGMLGGRKFGGIGGLVGGLLGSALTNMASAQSGGSGGAAPKGSSTEEGLTSVSAPMPPSKPEFLKGEAITTMLPDSFKNIMTDATTLGSNPDQSMPLLTTLPDYPKMKPLTPEGTSEQLRNTPPQQESPKAGGASFNSAMSFMAGPPEDFFSSSGFTSVTPDPNFYGPGGKSGFSAGRLA